MKAIYKPSDYLLYFLNRPPRVLTLILALTSFQALAHQPDQAFVYLQQIDGKLTGRLEITKADLQKVLNVPIPEGNGLSGLENYQSAAWAYIQENVAFRTNQGTHKLQFTNTRYLRTGWGGEFLLFEFQFGGLTGVPESMDVESSLMFEQSRNFQLWIIMENSFKTGWINNESIPLTILTRGDQEKSFELGEGSWFQGFVAMIKMGVWHIWIGLDHILFLIALLLPSVINYLDRKKKWLFVTYTDAEAKEGFRGPFIYILKVVTFFTIAHTITLSLASLEIVNLPSRFVETIIAVSIGLAALHNIRPVPFVQDREWLIAFVFGLFHGFGFATVLGELGVEGQYAVISLVGFNLGVELGQVAIILVVFPLLFFVRHLKQYPLYMALGSMALIFIASYWFIERAFDVDLPLGRFLLAPFR